MATPRKLWETNVGLRPATHIMPTFACLAIVANYLSNLCAMVLFLSSVLSPIRNGMKTIVLRRDMVP